LALAGPGGRSYAFIIDWHIRLLLALVWALGVVLVGRLRDNPEWVPLVAGIPAAIIYLFYHPVVELAMGGQTPGKRIAGVRVVSRRGHPPTVVAILIRNVFRLVDSFPAFYTVGLLAVMLTRDSVRIGDLAAGTVLVYLPKHTRKAADRQRGLAQQTRLPIDVAELVSDLLDRWPQLEPSVRKELAVTILQRAGESATSLAGSSEKELHRALTSLLESPG